MIGTKKVVAVMLMREGSVRIPNKCMKLMNKVPLCKITLDKLAKSSFIDDVYVSTSSKHYADILTSWGIKVIDRPEYLSRPDVILLDVMKDAVQRIDLKDSDYVIQTEPTKPLGKTVYFDTVILHAYNKQLDSCFTVKELKANLITDRPVPSQQKPFEEKKYLHFGYARLRTKETTLNSNGWGYGKKHDNLSLIHDYEIDIDYPYQWIMAEALLKEGY